jgi:Cd2+/Zn2+-exporting ATPase
MDIRPDCAYIEQGDELVQVAPDEVPVGTIITVRTGEKIPIDGVVVEGESTLNTAALTGESMPREVFPGNEVISGCINMTGPLKIRTTKEFGESTVSKILELVENSGFNKSNSERFITRFARIYTPIVVFGALIVAIIPPLVRMGLMGLAPEWNDWVFRALTFLVISCPCALVISIPLSFFAGIGGASRSGILIKGANYLESLSKTRQVVFDKTGTMTKGVFEVVAIHHAPVDDQKLLELAAHAEAYSTHPISECLRRAYKGTIDTDRIESIKEHGGHGIVAVIDDCTVIVGNEKLLAEQGIKGMFCHSHGSIVHVAVDGAYFGHIVIRDMLKPTSVQAVQALHQNGVRETVMLTGDREEVAREVADELGITDVQSGLLPEDKVRIVEEMMAKTKEKEAGGKHRSILAFVGDGINDAPVLARADVGVAMGALGADAAIEAADIVLMDDDPLKIAEAIRISRKCMRIVRENIVGAIGIKVLVLVLSAIGMATMELAIFADVGVMILAVLNAMRALRVNSL